MSSGGSPGRPVRATRARRTARRLRLRRGIAAVVVIALAVGAVWWVLGRSTTQGAAPPVGPSGDASLHASRPQLVSLDVVGGSAPYLAVFGTDAAGARPAAIPIPHDLTLVVPGQGEAPASDVAGYPGRSVQVALSNELGVWTPSYAVMTVAQLGGVATRMGGLAVNLPAAVHTAAGALGPGGVTLTGPQLEALLNASGGNPDDRWDAVLAGLMMNPPTLQRSDLRASSGIATVQRALSATTPGEVLPIPVQTVDGTRFIPEQPAFDHLVQSTWRTSAPARAIVQNGNGAADIGEAVARRIIPAGFRVVLSQNAQAFDMPTTDVIANGRSHADDARRAQRALGLGQVEISPVPSGVAEITIVVGKDFTA